MWGCMLGSMNMQKPFVALFTLVEKIATNTCAYHACKDALIIAATRDEEEDGAEQNKGRPHRFKAMGTGSPCGVKSSQYGNQKNTNEGGCFHGQFRLEPWWDITVIDMVRRWLLNGTLTQPKFSPRQILAGVLFIHRHIEPNMGIEAKVAVGHGQYVQKEAKDDQR